jgi:hypothetical protein
MIMLSCVECEWMEVRGVFIRRFGILEMSSRVGGEEGRGHLLYRTYKPSLLKTQTNNSI